MPLKTPELAQSPCESTQASTVELAPHGAYRLEVVHGDYLRVVAGAVWLTAAGFATDHLLTAGDAVQMERSGPTWVEPCALSTLVVERLGSTYLQ